MASVTSALGACGAPETWPKAQELLASMEALAVVGDIVAANAAANVCAQGGRWESAWRLFEALA